MGYPDDGFLGETVPLSQVHKLRFFIGKPYYAPFLVVANSNKLVGLKGKTRALRRNLPSMQLCTTVLRHVRYL